MVHNIIDFFKQLPPKKCSDCGETIHEQHDCYGNKCDKCLNFK